MNISEMMKIAILVPYTVLSSSSHFVSSLSIKINSPTEFPIPKMLIMPVMMMYRDHCLSLLILNVEMYSR